MPANYSLALAQTGPLAVPPDEPPAIWVDVFGKAEIELPTTSDLWTDDFLTPVVETPGSLDVALEGWQTVADDLPAGMYEIVLGVAAINVFGSTGDEAEVSPFVAGPWNLQRPAELVAGAPTYGPWLRSGGVAGTTHRLEGTAFNEVGFATELAARQASAGRSQIFYHQGGRLDGLVDDATGAFGDNVGTLTFTVRNVPSMTGVPRWCFTGPATLVADGIVKHPVLSGLSPGLHVVRFEVTGHDGRRRGQDIEVRAWRTPPRLAPAVFVVRSDRYRAPGGLSRDVPRAYRFAMENDHRTLRALQTPVKPARTEGDEYGGRTPHVRPSEGLRQRPKYSGVQPERPDDQPQQYLEPEELGDAEDY